MLIYEFTSIDPGELTLNLKPGMGWAVYTDTGPTGICGQSCDITCPHAYIAFWPDEDAMRVDLKHFGRNGSRRNIQYGVIGEYGSGRLYYEPE